MPSLGHRLTLAAVAVTDAIGYRSRSIDFGLALAAVAVTVTIGYRSQFLPLFRSRQHLMTLSIPTPARKVRELRLSLL